VAGRNSFISKRF